MIQSATAFAGGFATRDVLGSVRLPKIQKVANEDEAFKVSLRLVAASVPVLHKPGLVARQRPFLEVNVGAVTKETELADFVPGSSAGTADDVLGDCPWRFDEMLTFELDRKDVLGTGVRLRLRAHSDIQLGPLQLELKNSADIGDVMLSFEDRLLPACVHEKRDAHGDVQAWESPVLLAPLAHVRGGLLNDDFCLGQPVAHIAVIISVDTDPEKLVAVADAKARPVSSRADRAAQQLEEQANNVMRWLDTPIDISWLPGAGTPESLTSNWRELAKPPPEKDWVVNAPQKALKSRGDCPVSLEREADLPTLLSSRSAAPLWDVTAPQKPLKSPDLHPDGWVCRTGPRGRQYWHHLALGPAPWDIRPEPSVTPLTLPSPRKSTGKTGCAQQFSNFARGPEENLLTRPLEGNWEVLPTVVTI
mmetsp:Transcript_1002/g.2012  ORF Transcript_1002/g.2012 Transcript_1002/m.2012 type:complete len:419 (-) Transcript_1002:125-1381(-)